MSQQEGKGNPLLIVLSGPSGVGKDTVLAQLLERDPNLGKITTVTTRPRRPGEIEGKDYHFVSLGQFEQMIKEGRLLEYAKVYGNWYGVPKKEVTEALRSGKDAILRADIQGASTIKKLAPQGLFIFIAPPSVADLESRMIKRHLNSEDDRRLRLETAQDEMKAEKWFDYVIVNKEKELTQTVNRIFSVIEKERNRRPPRKIQLLQTSQK